MKNFITFLIVVLAFSTVAPSISFANGIDSNELSLNVSNQLETGLNVILDTDELAIFQLTESDGNTYEYVEKVTVLENNTELLTQEKYLVSSDMSKKLIDTKEVIIDEILESIHSELNSIRIEERASSSSASGGSYIADVRWKEYSNGYAHAIAGGNKVKYVKKTQWQYRDFKAAANELKGMERALLSGGVLGVTDALVAAFRKGEMLSWTLVKKVINQVGKGIPIVGTAYSVYQYGQKYFEAQDLYKKIPS